jgi:DNA-binding transcriptional ArsR family regulator
MWKMPMIDLMQEMKGKADGAAEFLSGLASPHRLLVLCLLASGEKSVGALVEETGIGQTSMSQHLAKLKKEGLVDFRRDHRTLYYAISDPAALEIMEILYNRFCRKD